MEGIYSTQQQRMFIQRQRENRHKDEISIDASYMALIAMASSAAVLEYSMFLCKVGRVQVHCQTKNNEVFFMKISAQKFTESE